METKIKWNEGDGYITATYEGSGSGSASISSDVNEGIDREQTIKVETTDKSVSASLVVSQVGLREVFEPSDGLFVLADGGTFNVLKVGGSEPIETYAKLTYIEATGEQYIDLGYVLKETDVIDMDYVSTSTEARDKMLFGAVGGGGNLWFSLYSNTAYMRFGHSSSTTYSNATLNYTLKMQKGKYTLNTGSGTLSYTTMPTSTLCLFGRNTNDSSFGALAVCRCTYFAITDADGNKVMELFPCKRLSDGKIGMIDGVSGTFYTSNSDVDFVGGSEFVLPEGYTQIPYVQFNNDKTFDACVIKNTYTVESMFARTSTSSAQYMYGIITSPHTASVTAYLTSSGSWRYGTSYASHTITNTYIHRSVAKDGGVTLDVTAKTFTKSTFTTPDTLIVGGSRRESGVVSSSFIGKMYYFRVMDGVTPILDWVPVQNSEGVQGFWDCVTQTFVEPM